MSARRWMSRVRLIQVATLFVGVTLLTLVVWSVTRSQPPAPPPINGTWLGAGSVYESTGGGSNQIVALLELTQTSTGQVSGSMSECNDHRQTAVFAIGGFIQGNTLTLVVSGVTLHGQRAQYLFAMTGSGNGTTIQLDLHPGNQAEYITACDALPHVEATLVP